jgi:hypothetical protein
MATGTTNLLKTGSNIGATLDAVVSSFNTVFAGQRLRIFDSIREATPASNRGGDTLVSRMLYEVMGAASASNLAGYLITAVGFEGQIDDVKSAYEAYFITNATMKPLRVIDLSDLEKSTETVRLLVFVVDTDDNPLGGLNDQQLFLVAAQGVIAAGASGTVNILDADGTVLDTATATNISTSQSSAANEPCYATVDIGSNEIVFLPTCCGVAS